LHTLPAMTNMPHTCMPVTHIPLLTALEAT
jgi:hypothetical protein